jgi:hypothetical protein
MKKDDIIKALKEANIEHNPSDTVPVLTKLLPEGFKEPKPEGPKTITVVCKSAALFEGGERYVKGDEIEVTPARAESLGKAVSAG